MKTLIKPIETMYRGNRFRSRLEARVAVFLDSLDVKYEYEPEGYHLESGLYLPDFLVHNFPQYEGKTTSFYIEVKATDPTPHEMNLLRELACTTGIPGRFMVGKSHPPYIQHPSILFKSFLDLAYRWSYEYDYPDISFFDYRQYPLATFLPFDNDGKPAKPPGEPGSDEREEFYDLLHDAIIEYGIGEQLAKPYIKASEAALSARFEHGEKP